MNVVNNLRAKLTPECSNMANTTSMVAIGAIILLFIVLIATIAYIFLNKSDSKLPGTATETEIKDAQNKKQTKLNILLGIEITGILLVIILNGWNVVISGKMKSCINQLA